MTRPDAMTLRQAIEEHREDIVEWTSRFVTFASENRPPGGAESDAQGWFHDHCADIGLEVDRFSPLAVPDIRNHPHWLSSRDYPPGRDNVAAIWQNGSGDGAAKDGQRGANADNATPAGDDAANPAQRGTAGTDGAAAIAAGRTGPARISGPSLLFSGHTDVAPREPGEWKVCAPFTPVVQDGRLYGRGTADMKGGIAAAYWAIRVLKELTVEPAGTVILEAVVDEEFAGGNGTLASRLRGYNADLAVYMEPSGMELCTAGLGAFLGDMTITGQAGMPYTGHDFSNPVFGMGRAIQLFDEWLKRWRARSAHPLFDPEKKPLNLVLWDLTSNEADTPAQMGTPEIAKVSWIVWCHPGTEEAEFYREFRHFWQEHFTRDEMLKGFEYAITPTYHYVQPWETDPSTEMVRKLTSAYRTYTGTQPAPAGAPFSSDLAVYGRYGGMPSVILGPRGDNLHGPDEWVLIDDLCELTGIFAQLILDHCVS